MKTGNTVATAPEVTVEFLGELEIKKAEFNSRTASVEGIDPNSIWAAIVGNIVSINQVTHPTTDVNGNPISASGLT